jgi:hypothetical protein
MCLSLNELQHFYGSHDRNYHFCQMFRYSTDRGMHCWTIEESVNMAKHGINGTSEEKSSVEHNADTSISYFPFPRAGNVISMIY